MVTFVCEKWCDPGCRVCRVVVRKFCKGQEVGPIVLLVVDVDANVLFKDLIDAFGLPIGLKE